MQDQAELITDIVEREVVLREHMLSDAYRAATDLIDKFLDPEHRVTNLQNFRSALAKALRDAREQGQVDFSGEVLTLL
jgi:type I site-specific restriction endonuclease